MRANNIDVENIIVHLPMHFTTNINSIKGIPDMTKMFDIISIFDTVNRVFSYCRDEIELFKFNNTNYIKSDDNGKYINIDLYNGNVMKLYNNSDLKLVLYYYMTRVLDRLENSLKNPDIGISIEDREIIYSGEKLDLVEFLDNVIETLLVTDLKSRISEFLNTNIIRNLHRANFLDSNNKELIAILNNSGISLAMKDSIANEVFTKVWKPYVLNTKNIEYRTVSIMGNFIPWSNILQRINYNPQSGTGGSGSIFYIANKSNILSILNRTVQSIEPDQAINQAKSEETGVSLGNKTLDGAFFKKLSFTPNILIKTEGSNAQSRFTKEGYNLFFKDVAIKILKDGIKSEVGKDNIEKLNLPINPLDDMNEPLDNKERARFREIRKKGEEGIRDSFGQIYEPPIQLKQNHKESNASQAELGPAIKSNLYVYPTHIKNIIVCFEDLVKHCISVGINPLSFNVLDIAISSKSAVAGEKYSINDFLIVTEVREGLNDAQFRDKIRKPENTTGISILERMRKDQEKFDRDLRYMLSNTLVKRPRTLSENSIVVHTPQDKTKRPLFIAEKPLQELVSEESKYDIDFKNTVPNRFELAARASSFNRESDIDFGYKFFNESKFEGDNEISLENRLLRDNYKPIARLDPGSFVTISNLANRSKIANLRLETANKILTDYSKVNKPVSGQLAIEGDSYGSSNMLESSVLKTTDLLLVETMAGFEVALIRELKANGMLKREYDKVIANKLEADYIEEFSNERDEIRICSVLVSTLNYKGEKLTDKYDFLKDNINIMRNAIGYLPSLNDVYDTFMESYEEFESDCDIMERLKSMNSNEVTEEVLQAILEKSNEIESRFDILIAVAQYEYKVGFNTVLNKEVLILKLMEILFRNKFTNLTSLGDSKLSRLRALVDITLTFNKVIDCLTEEESRSLYELQLVINDGDEAVLDSKADLVISSFNKSFESLVNKYSELSDEGKVQVLSSCAIWIPEELSNIHYNNTIRNSKVKKLTSGKHSIDWENIAINNLLDSIRRDLKSGQFNTLEEVLNKYNINMESLLEKVPQQSRALFEHFDYNLTSDYLREDIFDEYQETIRNAIAENNKVSKMSVAEYKAYKKLDNLSDSEVSKLKLEEMSTPINTRFIIGNLLEKFAKMRDEGNILDPRRLVKETRVNSIIDYFEPNMNNNLIIEGSSVRKVIFNSNIQSKSFMLAIAGANAVMKELSEDLSTASAKAVFNTDRQSSVLTKELSFRPSNTAEYRKSMARLGQIMVTNNLPYDSTINTVEAVFDEYIKDDLNTQPKPKMIPPDMNILRSSVSEAVIDTMEKVLQANGSLHEGLGLNYHLSSMRNYKSEMGEEYNKLPSLVNNTIRTYKSAPLLKEVQNYIAKTVDIGRRVEHPREIDANRFITTNIDPKLELKLVKYLLTTLKLDELPNNSNNILRTINGKEVKFLFGSTTVYLNSRGHFIVDPKNPGKLCEPYKEPKIPEGIAFREIASTSVQDINKSVAEEALDNILLPYDVFIEIYSEAILNWVADEIKLSIIKEV